MSNVIECLENLGKSAEGPEGAESVAMLARLSVAERASLLAGDSKALAALVGARLSMTCLIVAPEEEPQSDDEEPEGPAQDPDVDDARAA